MDLHLKNATAHTRAEEDAMVAADLPGTDEERAARR